ncbi:ribosomal protein bL36 [Streptomyces nigra]
MKVRKSLRSLKARPGAQVVRRRGVTFVPAPPASRRT